MWRSIGKVMLLAGVVIAVAATAGCAELGYYWQSASGHLGLMRAARPLPQWLADASTSDTLKARLQLAQRIRRFRLSMSTL